VTRARDYAALPTEAAHPDAARLDEMTALQIVRLMAREERRSVAAVAAAAAEIAAVAEAAARALAGGGRLIYLGAGTSGRLAALDAAECGPTFGAAPGQVVAVVAGGARALRRAVEGAEDDAAEGARRVRALRVGRRDLVVGVAASGVTPFVRAALEAAAAYGAATALITAAPEAARAAGARPDRLVGLEVGPEVLAGSTRLKAGTATKLALNAISTAAMVRLGKCYGPRMVDVVAGSAKLRARAIRMVSELTGAPPSEAARLLARAGGRVKTAVVMRRLGLDRRAAEARLAAAAGRLREVVGPDRGAGGARRHRSPTAPLIAAHRRAPTGPRSAMKR
jgi:N-acetylmuramic acid 6-phosphate etherase